MNPIAMQMSKDQLTSAAAKVAVLTSPTAEMIKAATTSVKQMPGRPSTDMIIRRLMADRSLTRAQAKKLMKANDEFQIQLLANRFLDELKSQLAGHHASELKPLIQSMAGA